MDKAERAAYNREYKQKNKEALAEKRAEYYQDNRETILEKNREYKQKNKEAIAEYRTKYREDHKQNITYIATLGSEYYFGHTSMGLNGRRNNHFADMRAGKGCAGLQKRFDELGEEAFKKIFDIQILGTYDTKEEALEQEKYLLNKYVGTANCLNVYTW